MKITSRAFDHQQPIPRKHSREGADVSPSLSWTDVPENAQELALVVDDPDAPRDEPWVHWVLYGLPAATSGLAEGSNGGGHEGRNDFGETGWGGPMPPEGHGTHHYQFHLYALDGPAGLAPGATKADLLKAIEGRILEQALLVGTYERK